MSMVAFDRRFRSEIVRVELRVIFLEDLRDSSLCFAGANKPVNRRWRPGSSCRTSRPLPDDFNPFTYDPWGTVNRHPDQFAHGECSSIMSQLPESGEGYEVWFIPQKWGKVGSVYISNPNPDRSFGQMCMISMDDSASLQHTPFAQDLKAVSYLAVTLYVKYVPAVRH
jgi:hypothetical protein